MRRLSSLIATSVLALCGAGAATAAAAVTGDYTYTPATCSVAPFSDVATDHPYCAWINQLAADQISSGCGGGKFCPEAPVTRGQMAMILQKTLRGTATWDLSRAMWNRTIVVPIVPGNEVASGTRLKAVLAGISDSGENNIYRLLLEAGTYDLDGGQLQLPQGLILEGAGMDWTKIVTTRSGAAIVGEMWTELRRLGVQNILSGASVRGIEAPMTLREVKVRVSAGTGVSIGLYCDFICNLERTIVIANGATTTGIYINGGVFNNFHDLVVTASASNTVYGIRMDLDAVAEIRDAEIRASGGDALVVGLQLSSTHATFLPLLLRDATIDAESTNGPPTLAAMRAISGDAVIENSRLFGDGTTGSNDFGLLCEEDLVQLHNSRVQGDNHSIQANTGCTVRFGAGQLAGGAVLEDGGTVTCVAAYSDSFTSPGLNSCF